MGQREMRESQKGIHSVRGGFTNVQSSAVEQLGIMGWDGEGEGMHEMGRRLVMAEALRPETHTKISLKNIAL